MAISAVTRAEVLKGRIEYLLKAADKSHWLRAYDLLVRTEVRLAEVEVIPVTEVAADHFDRLRAKRKRKKNHADLLVACIAASVRGPLAVITRSNVAIACSYCRRSSWLMAAP